MPQFNHFETKSGQQIDPTFGLNALSEETKRKTKAREQMNIAANVIRQSLAADGKGLTKGTEVNIEEGGQYTFNGDNATKDETNLYNIRKANYGKTGTGTNVTTRANNTPEQLAVQRQVAGEAGMHSQHDPVRGTGVAQSAQATAPTPTPKNYVELPVEPPTPISPVTAGLLGGTPIPLNPLMAAAAKLDKGQSMSQGESEQTGVNFSDSISNNYQNLKEVTTTSDIEVRDQLGMNQSDLAVASAMEALNSQVYGTTNPGVYKGLMEQNARTMQSTNDALTKQGQSVIMDTLNQGSMNKSMSTGYDSRKSKEMRQGAGNAQRDPMDEEVFWNPSGENVTAKIKGDLVQFTNAGERNVMVNDENALNFGNNVDGWSANFNDFHTQAGNPYVIKKDGFIYLTEGGKERKIARPKAMKSAMVFNKQGQLVAPMKGDKPLDTVIGLEFLPGELSKQDFYNLTAQRIGQRRDKKKD